MSVTTRVEQPCPGHFIASQACQFRRNTALVRGEKSIIVSTVGRYLAPAQGGERLETIGFRRWFETMVFHGKQYPQPTCCEWRAASGHNIDFAAPPEAAGHRLTDDEQEQQSADAQRLHEATVAKWATAEWPEPRPEDD